MMLIIQSIGWVLLTYLLLPSFVALCQLKLWQGCPKALLYHAFIIVPVELIGKVLNYILAFPLAALSVAMGVSVLPTPLNWFHTHDDDMDGGQHQLGWPVVAGFALICQRAEWMFRNSFYGGSFALFGEERLSPIRTISIGAWDSGTDNYSLIIDANNRFGLRKQWFYTKTRFVRIWIGWSFQGTPTNGRYITKCHVGLLRSWTSPIAL